MKSPLKTMRLPILTKDLLERASRKRTYIIRFVYGLVLFISRMDRRFRSPEDARSAMRSSTR